MINRLVRKITHKLKRLMGIPCPVSILDRRNSILREYVQVRIHFHVWVQTEIIELMLMLKKMFPFEIELICQNASETIVVLRKI